MLFTFIMSYKNGIYISQYNDKDVVSAFKQWALNLDIKSIRGIGIKSKNNLIKSLELDADIYTPIAIHNMNKVWCSCITLNNDLTLINIIETSTSVV